MDSRDHRSLAGQPHLWSVTSVGSELVAVGEGAADSAGSTRREHGPRGKTPR